MRFGLNLKSLKHKQVNNADFDCAFRKHGQEI